MLSQLIEYLRTLALIDRNTNRRKSTEIWRCTATKGDERHFSVFLSRAIASWSTASPVESGAPRCSWRSNLRGVTGQLGERHDALADLERPLTGRACRHQLDHSGHLESGDEGGLRRPRINAHALHQVGKTHAHGVDANECLAGLGRRRGRLANLEDFGRTIPPYDHGAHSILLVEAVDDAGGNTGDVGRRTESADAKVLLLSAQRPLAAGADGKVSAAAKA